MKIKIIDLLNKTANGEEIPKKIKYEYLIYELTPERNDYYCENEMRWFTNNINSLGVLTEEAEIIEEDKQIDFEEIEELTCGAYDFETQTINSLIKNQKKLINEINKIKGATSNEQ